MTPEILHTTGGLQRSFFHRQWGEEQIGSWELSISSGGESRSLLWLFRLLESSQPQPRGYTSSVRQRFESAKELPKLGDLLKSSELEESREKEILVHSIEGEPLEVYLKRTKPPMRFILTLLSDVICQLQEVGASPRLISNLHPNDFLVFSDQGVGVGAHCHPIFSILREEKTLSEFEIISFWGDFVARTFGAARNRWEKDISDYDPLAQRTFRRFLKSVRSGQEMVLAEALSELQRCLRREMDTQRPLSNPLLFLPPSPKGALQTFLFEEFSLERKDLLERDRDQEGYASPYVVSLEVDEAVAERRQASLLPPESWFEKSMIQAVNQKMAIPFLSHHPNTFRIRSLLCEENFTLVLSDECSGLPLPALLRLKGGLEVPEAIRLGRKICRALDQFESADFLFSLESPWQIQVYLQNESSEEWGKLISAPCREWPIWDIRIRVETPTESIVELPQTSAWNFLLDRMHGKSFPALLIWMLEWRRLEWAAKERALEREPLSWDPRFDALFTAATEHFEPTSASHRDRLLSLLEEGYAAEKVPSAT